MNKEEILRSIISNVIVTLPGYRKRVFRIPKINDIKLSYLQFGVIATVKRNSNISLNDLAQYFDMSKQQMSKIVDLLCSLNLLSRDINPNNRRMIMISLTKDGSSYINSVNEAIIEDLKDRLETLSQEKLKEIDYHLNAVSRLFSELTINDNLDD